MLGLNGLPFASTPANSRHSFSSTFCSGGGDHGFAPVLHLPCTGMAPRIVFARWCGSSFMLWLRSTAYAFLIPRWRALRTCASQELSWGLLYGELSCKPSDLFIKQTYDVPALLQPLCAQLVRRSSFTDALGCLCHSLCASRSRCILFSYAYAHVSPNSLL